MIKLKKGTTILVAGATILVAAATILICKYKFNTYGVSAATTASGNSSTISTIAASAVAASTTTSDNIVVLTIAHDDSSISLAWQKPANYSNISDYYVYMNGNLIGTANNNNNSQAKQFINDFYKDSSNSSAVKINMHNYVETGLTSNTSYSFVIAAVDSNGKVLSKSDAIAQITDKTPAVFDVTKYGAVGDGTTIDTKAVQAAINACTTGGEVLIPAGKVFKIGSIWLKDNMTLRVEGKILGSENPQDYISSDHPVSEGGKNNALINGIGSSSVQSLKIVGTGTINGNGWKQGDPQDGLPVSSKSSISIVTQNGILAANQYNLGIKEGLTSVKAYATRSNLISLSKINNVYIGDGLSLENPSLHTIGTGSGSNVVINGALIKTFDCNNADGLNFSSQGLIVMNSVFDTGDDDINFAAGRGLTDRKTLSPVKNIWIFNNYFAHGHGAVVAGSFTAAEIEDILAEDNVLNGTGSGLRAKSAKGIGGGAQDITFRDSALKNINDGQGQPFIFTSAYSDAGSVVTFTPDPDSPVFKHIFISNCSVDGAKSNGILVAGLADGIHTDMHFTNVSFTNTLGASINYMSNSSFKNVTFDKNTSNPWTITNSTNVTTN